MEQFKDKKSDEFNKYGEVANIMHYVSVLCHLQKNYICKYKENINRLENYTEPPSDEIDKVSLQLQINLKKKFLKDLEELKEYVEYHENTLTGELLQINAENGHISKVDNTTDIIKEICVTHCRTSDSLNVINDYAKGMNHAYRIILDIINNKKK